MLVSNHIQEPPCALLPQGDRARPWRALSTRHLRTAEASAHTGARNNLSSLSHGSSLDITSPRKTGKYPLHCTEGKTEAQRGEVALQSLQVRGGPGGRMWSPPRRSIWSSWEEDNIWQDMLQAAGLFSEPQACRRRCHPRIFAPAACPTWRTPHFLTRSPPTRPCSRGLLRPLVKVAMLSASATF